MPHQQLNYKQQLREKGYRITPQRQIILDTICRMGRHTTASEIYEQIHTISPAINRTTVYRTLAFFCEMNLLVSAKIEGRMIYEIAAPTPHHHLVCRQCGRVDFLTNDHFQDLSMHLITEHNFQPEISHLTIPGLCSDCREAAES